MCKELDKLREEWEKGMQIIVEKEIEMIGNTKKIVVLRDKNDRYFIHRYWFSQLQGKWQISVDLQDATLSELLEFLLENAYYERR